MLKIFKNLKKIDCIYICICILFVVIQIWLDLEIPDYTKKMTQAVSEGSATMSTVLENGGIMTLYAFLSMLSSIICGFFAAHVAANFDKTLRGKMFKKATEFSDAEMNRFSIPSLITRTTNDIVQMQMLIAMGLQMAIKAPILAVWAITKISATNTQWTMATLISVAIIVVLVGTIVGICYPKFKRIQRLTDDLNDISRENLSGIRVIRAFNAERYQSNKFDKVNTAIVDNQLFTSRVMGLMMPIMTVCLNGLTLAIYWIAAYLINQENLMARAVLFGNMVAFIQYALQVVMAFIMLIVVFILFPRAIVSARRIVEVLYTKPSITYVDDNVTLSSLDNRNVLLTRANKEENENLKHHFKDSIKFENVSFAYHGDDSECLSNLDFEIKKGETFAIIGATGSGKSSLVNLIPRFYDPTKGRITIDGVDIRELGKKGLESLVSIAPQKAILFKGSIKSNVVYGHDGVCVKGEDVNQRVRKSLDIASATFVDSLVDGIDSEVSQGGSNFSGGQKQRLSIARAVYKNADIVIFDDTFSALDYKTDMTVRKNIKEELKGATVIIVAQRIGTIKNADRILVIDEGKIAGIGKHEELLATCETYKEIALSQLSEKELMGR